MNVYNNVKITTPPYFNLAKITSTEGVEFLSFAKNGKFNKELYKDLVAPTLNTDMYVESWRSGSGLLPSDCSNNQEYIISIYLIILH